MAATDAHVYMNSFHVSMSSIFVAITVCFIAVIYDAIFLVSF